MGMTGEMAEIVEILERADKLFKSISGTSELANSLWNDGMDKLGMSVWVLEKEAEGK
jgi:hypothetical protein